MPEPKPAPASEPKSVPEPKGEIKPATDAAVAAPVAAAKVVAPASVATAKPVDAPASKEKKAEAGEKPAVKNVADIKSANNASGQWVVQLGAYKEAGNVKLLLAKLKGVGVPAYTEKFDSPQGARTRVRAGPFASQEAAEKARSRIKIIGVDGPVAPK
jgi:DedD protein